MPTHRSQHHVPLVATLAAALAGTLFACVTQAAAADARGQWIGRTLVEGQRDADKTTLSLGAIDEESTTLELDTGRTCKLREGTYSDRGADAWSLHFKPTSGSGLCDRLSRGEFTLRAAGPRKLAFEARYPDGKGGQNKRNGVLVRYP
ncbi:MAG: hypothetical protein JSS59_03695 [Proteobacteria bacterium]|uniref:hypothetical protein n=1 Tax=Rudaea sp. TaxID=2136325 RepID=UPI00378346A2|nr:hypothetical protein [Pseudomonadota bacterium]